MREPDPSSMAVYLTIAGVAALLVFAFLLTSSFWLTLVVMALGVLHIARHFPAADAIVEGDPALRWLRRLSPAIVVGIFIMMVVSRALG